MKTDEHRNKCSHEGPSTTVSGPVGDLLGGGDNNMLLWMLVATVTVNPQRVCPSLFLWGVTGGEYRWRDSLRDGFVWRWRDKFSFILNAARTAVTPCRGVTWFFFILQYIYRRKGKYCNVSLMQYGAAILQTGHYTFNVTFPPHLTWRWSCAIWPKCHILISINQSSYIKRLAFLLYILNKSKLLTYFWLLSPFIYNRPQVTHSETFCHDSWFGFESVSHRMTV